MKEELLEILACPRCKNELGLTIATRENNEIKEGKLVCKSCGTAYPISDYIPRFVKSDKYVDNFSFEWNLHRETQLDSISGTNESEQTFKRKTGFNMEKLKNKLVLDVGCGAGRFTEVVEKYGGDVVGVDLSFSVDAAFKNLGFKENVHIVQADVFDLPFREEIFDYIFSIGVLHHTPNTEEAFKCLPKFLKNRGEIAMWVYSNEGSFTKIHNKISGFYRFFTTKCPKKLLYRLSYFSLPLYYLKRIKILGYIASFILPHSGHPNPEWRILDTFDWYSPRYQWKHTYNEVVSWFKESGLKDIKTLEVPVAVNGKKS